MSPCRQCSGFDKIAGFGHIQIRMCFLMSKSNPNIKTDLMNHSKIQIKSKSNPNLFQNFNFFTKSDKIQIKIQIHVVMLQILYSIFLIFTPVLFFSFRQKE